MNIEEVHVKDKRFWGFWNVLIKSTPFHHSLYTQSGVKLIEDYNENQKPFCNLSVVFLGNGIPQAGILMTVNEVDSRRVLSCFGYDLYYKENFSLDRHVAKSLRQKLKQHVETVIQNENITDVYHRDFDSIDGGASVVSKFLLDKGALSNLAFIQLIDLSRDIDVVYSDIGKSCRNNINRSLKQNDFNIVTSKNLTWSSVDRLKELHFLAAGRKTRSDVTWEDLSNMIKLNEAFLIEAIRGDDCVASSLFFLTETSVIYAISAADRKLFNDPLNHGLIWKAIEFSKSLGCKYFELGSLTYNTSDFLVTPKEFNINRFKKNFGGETIYQLKTNLSI